MKKFLKIALWSLLILLIAEMFVWLLDKKDFVVLLPKGMIGLKQRDLIYTSLWLMCIVVIPTIVMTLWFAWKFREGNPKAKYSPEWDHSHKLEAIWWGVPCIIIIFLSVITWKSSFELDPYKPIETDKKALTIQVIALRWKWLFLYPEEGIASVNFIQFPEKRPILFEITADAPMNSFWIPQLGGQIYAMAGMRTNLYLVADEVGTFQGRSANLSGPGFSGMTFVAEASTEQAFEEWIAKVKSQSPLLTEELYTTDLLAPSRYNPAAFYTLGDRNLFDKIVMKPMGMQ